MKMEGVLGHRGVAWLRERSTTNIDGPSFSRLACLLKIGQVAPGGGRGGVELDAIGGESHSELDGGYGRDSHCIGNNRSVNKSLQWPHAF